MQFNIGKNRKHFQHEVELTGTFILYFIPTKCERFINNLDYPFCNLTRSFVHWKAMFELFKWNCQRSQCLLAVPYSLCKAETAPILRWSQKSIVLFEVNGQNKGFRCVCFWKLWLGMTHIDLSDCFKSRLFWPRFWLYIVLFELNDLTIIVADK